MADPVILATPEQLGAMIEAAVARAVSRIAPADELMSISDVGELLKISDKTVAKLIKKGLPAHGVGRQLRFFRHEVLAWVAEQEAA
jgi:excisionase family DNA binding protein